MSLDRPQLSDPIEHPPRPHAQDTALSESPSRKSDAGDATTTTSTSQHLQPPRTVRRFSTTPHFDLASSSSTAYIALPVPEQMDPAPPAPKGRLASFFYRNLGLFLIAAAQMFFSTMNLCAKLF